MPPHPTPQAVPDDPGAAAGSGDGGSPPPQYRPHVATVRLWANGSGYDTLQRCPVNFALTHANKGFEASVVCERAGVHACSCTPRRIPRPLPSPPLLIPHSPAHTHTRSQSIQFLNTHNGEFLLGLCEGNFCAGERAGLRARPSRLLRRVCVAVACMLLLCPPTLAHTHTHAHPAGGAEGRDPGNGRIVVAQLQACVCVLCMVCGGEWAWRGSEAPRVLTRPPTHPTSLPRRVRGTTARGSR